MHAGTHWGIPIAFQNKNPEKQSSAPGGRVAATKTLLDREAFWYTGLAIPMLCVGFSGEKNSANLFR